MATSETQFGKYQLGERLAAGGMAEIFRARFSPAPGVVKPVVIKKILPHYAANRAFVAMFTNEARIVMGLSHGNIAQVFDFGDVDGEWYLAMELVDGQPLSKIVKRMRAMGILVLPEAFAAFITSEMLKGLHYAHSRLDEKGRPLKIIHRDISPQNVLVSYEGQVKLVDFGIARARNAGREDASSRAVKGKYAYFAPEQARGKELDARTDIFAAGIVLYELLTGQLPFQGRMMEVLTRIVKGQFERPTAINPAIPKPLEDIVLKAMALHKGQRYQTAEAFQHDVARYLAVHHPDFAPADLSNYLQLLFEPELVRSGRPVLLPRGFVERVERWKRGEPVPEPAPGAPPPPGEDPEEAIHTDMVNVESGGGDSDELPNRENQDEDWPTRPIHMQEGSADEPAKRSKRAPMVPWARAMVLGAAASVLGFAAVFTAVKVSRGTLEIVSTPPGATVRINGRAIDQKTPIQVKSLIGGRTYRVEVLADGFKTWTNDVPLRRGQLLVVEAQLEAAAPPSPLEPVEVAAPPRATESSPTPPAQLPSEVAWPTRSFEIDAAIHRVDLSKAPSLRLTLDQKQTYRVTLNKGSSLGWGYYVVNAAGATPGVLPTATQQISGATHLFVFRIAGATRNEDAKTRTLSVESGGKTKTYKLPPAVNLSKSARIALTGLDPKGTYELLVRQSVTPARLRPSGAIVSRIFVGHPNGLMVADVGTAMKVTQAKEVFFTLVDDASDDQSGRLIIEVRELKRTSRR